MKILSSIGSCSDCQSPAKSSVKKVSFTRVVNVPILVIYFSPPISSIILLDTIYQIVKRNLLFICTMCARLLDLQMSCINNHKVLKKKKNKSPH